MIHGSIRSQADLQALQTRRRPPPTLHQPPPPSRRRRKEKTIRESICSHADLEALRTRADVQFVNLVSLESVRIALKSYALLCPLVNLKSWICPQLDLLSLVASLSLELHKVEHDLLPPLLDQEAKLEGGAQKTLLLLKNSAMTISSLGEGIKKLVAELNGSLEEELQEGGLSHRVKEVAVVLKDTADQVLNGHNIVWLQARVPCALDLVIALLAAPVSFPE